MISKIEFSLAQLYLHCLFDIFQLMYPCEDPYGVDSETGGNSLPSYLFSQKNTEKSNTTDKNGSLDLFPSGE